MSLAAAVACRTHTAKSPRSTQSPGAGQPAGGTQLDELLKRRMAMMGGMPKQEDFCDAINY